MIIKPLMRYKGDLELRWVSGYYRHSTKGLRVSTLLLNHDNGATIAKDFPFSMLPLLTPGMVVSHGAIQLARRTGRQLSLFVQDLSMGDETDASQCGVFSHLNLNARGSGDQKILRYQAQDMTILVPAIELIRFLFLNNRILADSLLLPAGLMDLAVTPLPGIYKNITIEFTEHVPRKLLTSEFVQEFAWLSVHPDARRAWDSVMKRSVDRNFLALDPPPLQNCQLECRGMAWDGHLLVLEILSLTGRHLPASRIHWTHPLIREKMPGSSKNASRRPQDSSIRNSRPRRNREYVVDGISESKKDNNREVDVTGGKRGCFSNRVEVIREFGFRKTVDFNKYDVKNGHSLNSASNTTVSSSPVGASAIDRMPVSMNDLAFVNGLPPVELSVLESAAWEHIGSLGFLNSVLQRIESSHQGLTVTRKLCYLKCGAKFSFCGNRRRAYLLAIFTFPMCPPRVLIDVDHSNRDELSALFLRYDTPTPLAEVTDHVKEFLDALVSNYGHWDNAVEARLSRVVTIQRFPKLFRMTKRLNDAEYVRRWIKRLNNELHLYQMNLNDAWMNT